MVCLGNICRSPLAEGILKHKAKKEKLNIIVDSAGFEPYHVGDPPDIRSQKIAQAHGIDIAKQRARLFKYDDFKNFDKIYVMDENIYDLVMNMAKTNQDKNKVDFLLNLLVPNQNLSIPDPYYDNINGFENTYNLINKACDKLIEKIKNKTI